MKSSQKEAFLAYEANAWFERNLKVISNYFKIKADDLLDPTFIHRYF